MKPYHEQFSVATTVRIVERAELERFRREWPFHNKLEARQLSHAGRVARVTDVGFYHGGDVLYRLDGVPGIWHEVCLHAVG
jgi:hypothetical protein